LGFPDALISANFAAAMHVNHSTSLKEGDKAPDFRAKDQDGNMVSLKDMRGKKLVLYFYPHDNSQTCTQEACNLRDNFELLRAEGFEVLGVCEDEEKKHKKFISKYGLPFPLIADTDHAVINAYDVWGPKLFMGRIFDSVARTTFLIDEEGRIEKVITKVVSKDHANQILEKGSKGK
jgi:thioredoxin-dependent peroxiredoxin